MVEDNSLLNAKLIEKWFRSKFQLKSKSALASFNNQIS